MVWSSAIFVVAVLLASTGAEVAAVNSTATKPHIVFVLVDDWGYADVSFRNLAIHSPNFQKLADTGLILGRHYVFKYCSPSRASFLTGRWPHHAHQWNLPAGRMAGTNLNMTMLPAKLKNAGYSTYMVGKWHQGLFDPKYLPINRGFDTSTGFLNGGENHMNAKMGCATDYWKNDAPDSRNGTYDAYNYRDDLTDIFSNHNTGNPMFLYLPLHNVHTPLQAPQEWLDLYPANSTCKARHTYQAMVSVADNVTGHLVKLLQKSAMWDNTIFIVSADNGGAPCGGSNYPLKGCKGTFFEGGVRSLAFANGGLLPDSMRGKTTNGFIHIADWYATFCKLAGVDPTDSGDGKFPVDSMDAWQILTEENGASLHDEIVLGYDFSAGRQGAIIVGDYKLIVNPQKFDCDSLMWSPLDYPCSQGENGPDCNPHCLYDIINDPNEKKDLSAENPEKVKELLQKYDKYSQESRDMQDQGIHAEGDLPNDPDACKYMKDNGGYWRPWKNLDY